MSQGAPISCLLANVYLHYVMDLWTQKWRQRQGDLIVVRYADDAVLGFQHEQVARRYRAEMVERPETFGLELNEDKTRLLRFGRYAEGQQRERGEGKPSTFDFLGFTHVGGKSRAGRFLVMRRTSKKRQRAKLRQVKEELLKRRHQPIPEQGRWLGSVVRGYAAYHAVPNNGRQVDAFRREVTHAWRRALKRRGQRRRIDWTRMRRLVRRYIPSTRLVHPWPWQRFDATTRGKSLVR